jgi:hypothetical protein
MMTPLERLRRRAGIILAPTTAAGWLIIAE